MGLNDEAEKVRQAVEWVSRSIVAEMTGRQGPTTSQVAASIDFLHERGLIGDGERGLIGDAVTKIADRLQSHGPDEYPRGFYEHLAKEAIAR